MGKEKKIWKWTVEVHKMEGLYPYVRLEDFMKVCKGLEEENKKLKSDLSECECSMHFENDEVGYRKRECKKLKDRIDILYEFIERNDKLVDEVIDEEDLDKLNRYIYIDDDLVDRTLESED